MPMGKFSTLIYLVNNIEGDKCELHSNEDYSVDNVPVMDFEPSERSIKNILDFARSYEVLESESTGHVEMILN